MTGKIKSVYTLEDLLAKMTAEAALRPKVTPLQDYPKVPGTKVEFTNINLFNDTLNKYYGTHNNHVAPDGGKVYHRISDRTMVCGIWCRKTKSGYVIIPLGEIL